MSWIKRFALPVCTLFLLLPHALFSQGLPAGRDELFLPAGTPVELQSVQTISSARAHKGDRVSFIVTRDVQSEGFTVISVGARAEGSVIGVKGKRPLGMGGDLIIKLDSVELATGDSVSLVARKEFKGRSHTIRMGVAMAIAAAIYFPVAPAFMLSRGRDSTVLKGTELTAYTRNDASVEIAGLPPAEENVSGLSEMLKMLPSRVTNADGREGDMLNLIFQAREEDLQEAFAQAGWLKVEKSKRLIFWHLLWQRGHYTKLPMDRLYVFGRAQDYSYALPDPLSIVSRRHHLRIWNTGRLVDGVPLWVAAATHDISIHFVKRKFRLFHRIDPNVDAERDFIAGNLSQAKRLTREEYMNCPQPVTGAQTATGQPYYSDSRMLLLELHRGAASMPVVTQIASKLP
ncbi:MAG TPA: LssY C-terminal domain-containing protein [Candidatus Acidoferrum sp.]|nr:LssY C-terminal domain-containing protein [Candidatus Acidoferrum sp.]